MSEMKVSPVLFKHAFFLGGGHVITETVASVCILIVALLVIFLGNMLFSCAASAVMVLMGALKADQQKCLTKSWPFLVIVVLLRLLIFGVLAWLLTLSLVWVSIVVGIVLTNIVLVIKQHPRRRTTV